MNLNDKIQNLKLSLTKCNHLLAQFDAELTMICVDLNEICSEIVSLNQLEENRKFLFDFDLLKSVSAIFGRLTNIIKDSKYQSLCSDCVNGTFNLFGEKILSDVIKEIESIAIIHGAYSCGCQDCVDHPANTLSKGQQFLDQELLTVVNQIKN